MKYNGWELLLRLDGVEVWKTPTQYLACNHYLLHFKFFKNVKKAIDYAYSIVNIK